MVRRGPLAAAVAFAVLSVFAVIVVPPGPGVEAPGSDVVAHIGAHAPMIRLQALLAALAVVALVVVIGHARERIGGPAGHVFVVGAALLVVQTCLRLWFSVGMVLHSDSLDPATARVLADVAAMWFPLQAVAAVLLAGPVVWAAGRGAFPQWMAMVAAVFAVEQGVELLTVVGPVGSFIAPGGPMNVYLGGALYLLFGFTLGLAVALPDQPASTSPSINSAPHSTGHRGEPS